MLVPIFMMQLLEVKNVHGPVPKYCVEKAVNLDEGKSQVIDDDDSDADENLNILRNKIEDSGTGKSWQCVGLQGQPPGTFDLLLWGSPMGTGHWCGSANFWIFTFFGDILMGSYQSSVSWKIKQVVCLSSGFKKIGELGFGVGGWTVLFKTVKA